MTKVIAGISWQAIDNSLNFNLFLKLENYGVTVGDKINSVDTWILILKHLGVISRTFVMTSRKMLFRYNDASVLSNPVTVRNISRSPSLIGANISQIFTPRRFDRSYETVREV
jgi:hypothetical protein